MPLPTIPDYTSSIKVPQLVHPPLLQGGHPVEKGNNVVKYTGGFCVVFPYTTPSNKYAVRCWHAEISDAKKRTQLIATALKESNLPYFVGFEFFEDGIITPQGSQPVVVMDWVDAKPLKIYIDQNLGKVDVLNRLTENFKKMVFELHQHRFSHGDLQHGNILVRPDDSLVLVDYDSMYVPALEGMDDEIKGLPGYQHEARMINDTLSEKADYFSELVIYTTLKTLACDPTYWYKLRMADSETLLFSAEDIHSKGKTTIFRELRNIPEVSPLVDVICEYMGYSSIDQLRPLEKSVIIPSEAISSKWADGNGYTPSIVQGHIDNSNDITDKWGKGNGYKSPDQKVTAAEIGAKWRR